MEGHLGPGTSTSPTRTEIHEFSDREYYDMITSQSEAQELLEEHMKEQGGVSVRPSEKQFLVVLRGKGRRSKKPYFLFCRCECNGIFVEQ